MEIEETEEAFQQHVAADEVEWLDRQDLQRPANSLYFVSGPVPLVGDAVNLKLNYPDYPSAWAIQREGVGHTSQVCSAIQTGGAMLCDCGAVEREWWQRKRAVELA